MVKISFLQWGNMYGNVTLSGLFWFLGSFIGIAWGTVIIHRGLAHDSLLFSPRAKRWAVRLTPYIAGFRPGAWVLMHRVHHASSDRKAEEARNGEPDPHSLRVAGSPIGVIKSGFMSMRDYRRRYNEGDEKVLQLGRGLEEMLPEAKHSVLHRFFYFVPVTTMAYLVAGIAGWQLLFVPVTFALLGLFLTPYAVALLVNIYGHQEEEIRTRAPRDCSSNTKWLALISLGEGLQKNHHHYQKSADQAGNLPGIYDLGFLVCVALDWMPFLGITINREHLISRRKTLLRTL